MRREYKEEKNYWSKDVIVWCQTINTTGKKRKKRLIFYTSQKPDLEKSKVELGEVRVKNSSSLMSLWRDDYELSVWSE